MFGSGFPTIPMQNPKTRLDREKVLFYDASAFNLTNPKIKASTI